MSELLQYLVENEPEFRKSRLPALYSDFRSHRSLNPDSFSANVAAWKRGLSSAAWAGHAPSSPKANTTGGKSRFTVALDEHLLRSLESKQFGRPLALGTVLQDAVVNAEMIPAEEFMKSTETIYARRKGQGWTLANIPWSVMSWGLRQAGLIGDGYAGDDKIPRGQFVVLENLERAATTFAEVTADLASPFERTFSKTQFRQAFAGRLLPSQASAKLSDEDLDVLVRFLSRDKGILTTDGQTIKIINDSDQDDVRTNITEEDSAIASLKELTDDLNKQIDLLTARVDALSMQAQDAVRRKNRTTALALLKNRKQTEATLAARHTTLSQLEDVAARIQQASDNVAMVRVMQQSTEALRSLNGRVGGADRVDAVLDDLREQMGEAEDIGRIVSEGATSAPVDEAEVDDELEKLLAEESKMEQEKEQEKKAREQAEETRKQLAELDKLGPVPDGAPVAGETDKAKETLGEREDLRSPTPTTAAARDLEHMHISEGEKKENVPLTN